MRRAMQMLVVLSVLALIVIVVGCGGSGGGPGEAAMDTAKKPPPPPPPPPPDPTDCKIVFTRAVEVKKKTWVGHLFTINTDGTDVRQITSGTGAAYYDAAWHPDGQSVCCTHDYDLYRVFLDGSAPVKLASGERSAGYAVEWEAWSPDGEQIAFALATRIYILDLASGQITQLNQPLLYTQACSLKWSPDGATIMFCGSRGINPKSDHLYSVPSTTVGAPHAPTLAVENARYPDWCAAEDGSGNSKIAYTGAADGALYTVTVSAVGEVLDAPQMVVAGPEATMPSWAPDGSEIVFHRKSAGKLYIVDVATLQVRELTAAGWIPPDWSPAVFGGS